MHPVFHIFLLKDWRTTNLQQDHPASTDDELKVEEPYYEIGKILWRKCSTREQLLKEYLILWKGYPIEEP